MASCTVVEGFNVTDTPGVAWEYEVKAPELDTSVFVIPKDYVKNG
jgi:hypothetical protein